LGCGLLILRGARRERESVIVWTWPLPPGAVGKLFFVVRLGSVSAGFGQGSLACIYGSKSQICFGRTSYTSASLAPPLAVKTGSSTASHPPASYRRRQHPAAAAVRGGAHGWRRRWRFGGLDSRAGPHGRPGEHSSVKSRTIGQRFEIGFLRCLMGEPILSRACRVATLCCCSPPALGAGS
jgi:hypothetical protein